MRGEGGWTPFEEDDEGRFGEERGSWRAPKRFGEESKGSTVSGLVESEPARRVRTVTPMPSAGASKNSMAG